MTTAAPNIEPSLAEELANYDDLLIPVCAVDEELCVTYFNEKFAGFAKLSPHKLQGKPLFEVLRCQTIATSELITRSLSEWRPFVSDENSVEVGGGELRNAIFKFIPHESRDGSRYVIVNLQDVSRERLFDSQHRVQLEELKAKNEEIKKYSERLELLVAERTYELRAAMEQSEKLLLNILPEKIAQKLKTSGGTIADRFESVSVLFVDVASFTTIASGMDPVRVVEFLSTLFNTFDGMLDKYGVEKIKTIGDAYMAVAGAPIVHSDHAFRLCHAALEMRDAVADLGNHFSFDLKCRFGISSGPVVAGVLGMKKFAYDIWGDTVNVASRMESYGVPGRVQIAATTYEMVKGHFLLEERGVIDVKGKGAVKSYFLNGAKLPRS